MNKRQMINAKFPWWSNEEEKKAFDPKETFEEALFGFVNAANNGQPMMAVQNASVVIRLLIDRVEALESAEKNQAKPAAPKKAAAAEE